MALTKKKIKELLLPLDYRKLKPGHPVMILGKRMYWQQLYNAPGQIGYVWNPSYVIEKAYAHIIGSETKECNANFANKTDMVDWLHINQPEWLTEAAR